jgi:hypothetical protein
MAISFGFAESLSEPRPRMSGAASIAPFQGR